MNSGQALPPAPDGWFSVRYGVTGDGCLTELCADQDVRVAWAKRRPVRPDGQALIRTLRVNGDVETGPRFGLGSGVLAFDRLPNGSWAIAEVRCSPGEDNLRIVQPDGTVGARFCVGDGVEHLQCDARGDIWVGYFDEGVYGNNGWGWHQGQPEPLGRAGLNRFSDRGELLWRFRPPRDQPSISDCYALNVTGKEAWACYYTDFPILRVEPEGGSRLWRNSIVGVRELLVQGEHTVLVGGYGDERGRVALVTPGEETATVVRTFHFEIESGVKLADAETVIGRGDRLHVVRGGVWRVASVSDLAT
jgi:hypothetical protein